MGEVGGGIRDGLFGEGRDEPGGEFRDADVFDGQAGFDDLGWGFGPFFADEVLFHLLELRGLTGREGGDERFFESPGSGFSVVGCARCLEAGFDGLIRAHGGDFDVAQGLAELEFFGEGTDHPEAAGVWIPVEDVGCLDDGFVFGGGDEFFAHAFDMGCPVVVEAEEEDAAPDAGEDEGCTDAEDAGATLDDGDDFVAF